MNVKVSKSKIEGAGKGLFTNQAFKKGDLIGLAHKDGQPVGDIGKMHNHSEDPTAFSVKFGNKRFIYANKDLKPGEEITTDYRMQPELEQPDDFKKGGSVPKMPKKKNAKAYSRSLEATNRLFTKNPLFEQPKSRKNKIYDPKSKYYQDGGSKLGPISLNSGRYAAKKYPFGKFSGVFKKQNGGEPTSPEEWAEAIKAVEREIGNPDNWTYDDLSKLQGKLYEYKAWREQHPEVIDTHNKPFEYEVPLPKQLNPAAVLQEGGESGYIELELTPEEIEQYKKGGYIIEDISIPRLNGFQFGGGKEARKLKRAQRRAGEPIQGYTADPIFDITTELGFKRQQLLNQSLGRPEIQADPWDQQRWLMEQNMADEEAGLYEAPLLPQEEVESEPVYDAVEQIDYGPVPEGVPKTTEEYKEFIKPETTTFKDLSRPSSEIILKREMSDELANALKEGGYYINQLYTGDYEVFANKDIADLIYKKGITSTQLSDEFNLGDPKTLQKYFEPVYNSAKSIHAKRNIEKIDNLIGKGYSKDQAIKELVKQGEGTIEGLTADYGGYLDATYKKYKAEADALTTLGITDISNLTDYQKKQLLNVATVKSDAKSKLDKVQADAAFLNTYMPEVGESTAYRGIIGVDANGQAVYGTTAYDKAQNELAATREMTDLYNATSAQIETGKAILTSPNLTDEQRKQFMENADKFNEIYQSYVEWMNAPEGEPNYGPGNDPLQRMKYYGDAYTRFIPGSLKSDFTINPDGTTSWHEGTYEQTVTIDGPVQMLYPEQYVIGGGGGLVGGALRGMGRVLAYSPVASMPWLNLGSALEADMAYQAFKDEGYVDQSINAFEQGNYLEGTANAAMGALGTIGPLKLISKLGQSSKVSDAVNFLTTQTPLKNTWKYNPNAGKLGEYNRVVGQDAIDDIIESGLVRVNENAGVAQDLGPLGVVYRQTPYPSFAKAAPQKTYAEQVISEGKIPYIISTNRPMRVSTLGRHGRGSTQFPIDETGKYISGFPANEAKVFEFTDPHWLRGYKPVNTSVRNIEAENIIRSGSGGMDMSRYEIKNPDYYTQLLNTYDSRMLSQQNRKFYTDLINTVKKQNGIVTERQYNELQRLKTGNFNYGKRGYAKGGVIELELTPKEIEEYKSKGYIVEEY